jgi:hypothetical protein
LKLKCNYILTMTSQYITDSILINLSSSSATVKLNSTMNSNLLFKCNGILKPDKHILYTTISVLNAQIPISYYLINSTNNKLVINNISYTLVNGNYTTTSIMVMILSLIPSTFTMTFNSATGKFTLTNTAGDFNINSTTTCYIILGLVAKTLYSSSSKTFTFPNPANLYGIHRIKIKSNILHTRNYDSNSGSGNILTTIGVTSGLTGVLYFLNQSNFRNIISNDVIDNIDIQIVDEYDNLLDFNGLDIFLTIQLDIIKEIEHNKEDLLTLLARK